MDLSDSPASGVRLMDSADASSRSKRDRRQGSPSLPNLAFPARCPLRPRRAPSLLVNISSRRISGFGISDRLATLNLRNEANSGLLALRLAGSFHGASTRRLLDALSASLHAGYSVGMMNTFQFIGLVGGAGAPKTQRRSPLAWTPASTSPGRLGGRKGQKALVATFSNVENSAALAARESTRNAMKLKVSGAKTWLALFLDHHRRLPWEARRSGRIHEERKKAGKDLLAEPLFLPSYFPHSIPPSHWPPKKSP